MLLEAGADPNKPGISDPGATFRTLIEAEKAKGKKANKVMTTRADQPLQVQYITLLDLSGKAVYHEVPTGSFTMTTIPVNRFSEGMYMLQMNVNGLITNHKVVVR
jgi:hypothetical protein